MTVYFIGAGPGAADLLTLRGRDILGRCPVCLYAGSLVPAEMLDFAPGGARLVDTAPLSLEEIAAEFQAAREAGQDVARLHSGDPSLYSALAEQTAILQRLGMDFEIVPGVPAYAAAAAALRRELTVPGIAQSLVLTRLSGQASPVPEGESLEAFARTGATLAIHLSIKRLSEIVTRLSPILGPDCPIAIVARASQADETIVTGTLADIEARAQGRDLARAATIFIGQALAKPRGIRSALYDSAHIRPFRRDR